MARRRVAITGLGCVTPIGEGADGLWSGLQRRRSGIAPITFFDASLFRTRIAAEVPNFDPADRFGAKRARRIDRYSALALTSTSMALEDAGLDPGTTLP
ncbi:MAG: beta-ketoacyl synthase N-terminal-like domain-containing protein, partial [Gemmatimonadota bacterium]